MKIDQFLSLKVALSKILSVIVDNICQFTLKVSTLFAFKEIKITRITTAFWYLLSGEDVVMNWWRRLIFYFLSTPPTKIYLAFKPNPPLKHASCWHKMGNVLLFKRSQREMLKIHVQVRAMNTGRKRKRFFGVWIAMGCVFFSLRFD